MIRYRSFTTSEANTYPNVQQQTKLVNIVTHLLRRVGEVERAAVC
jgi:hypothetical protein